MFLGFRCLGVSSSPHSLRKDGSILLVDFEYSAPGQPFMVRLAGFRDCQKDQGLRGLGFGV